MELVVFQNSNINQENKQPQIKVAKKRKPGAGRKTIYTSRSVSFSTSVPQEAINELKEIVDTLKAKYKK
jgi:hypothetical protein